MSVPGYDSYRDSGAEWLGQVPAHWSTLKLSRLVDPRRAITYGIVQAGPDIEDGVPYIRPADMTDELGVRNPEGLLRTSREIATAYRRSTVQTGDLVCSIGPSFGKVMVVPPSLDGANLTQGTARVAVGSGASARFVFWTLRSRPAISQWESGVGGATFGALNLEPLARTLVCCPPESEQAAIAAFLDRETGKIDGLVEAQRRLIELLKEKRQAVISHAVTKGIDPTVPMNDSGVEWLGELPAHWEVKKLGGLCSKIGSGKTPNGGSETYVDEGIAFLRSQNVYDEGLWLDELVFIDPTVDEAMASTRVLAGDVLLNITGASLGRTCIVPDDFRPANVNQHVCIIRLLNSGQRDFVSLALKSTPTKGQIEATQNGAAREGLNFQQIASLWIAMPPPDEADRIGGYINDQIDGLDRLSQQAEAGIALLQERRSALISAAVTGKIDVRGLFPEPAEAA